MEEVFDCLDIEGVVDGELNYQKLRFLYCATYERLIRESTIWTTTGAERGNNDNENNKQNSQEGADVRSQRNERMKRQSKESHLNDLRSVLSSTILTSPPSTTEDSISMNHLGEK